MICSFLRTAWRSALPVPPALVIHRTHLPVFNFFRNAKSPGFSVWKNRGLDLKIFNCYFSYSSVAVTIMQVYHKSSMQVTPTPVYFISSEPTYGQWRWLSIIICAKH